MVVTHETAAPRHTSPSNVDCLRQIEAGSSLLDNTNQRWFVVHTQP